MKKISSLIFASLSMILFTTTVVFSAKPSSAFLPNPSNETGVIKYQVQVIITPQLASPNCHMLVVVTDEMNRSVGSPQIFVPGASVYYFTESGPVTGTRTARLQPARGISAFAFYAEPDERSGNFNNNLVYSFTLNATHNLPK